MWLLDRDSTESNPYQCAPFQHITQISYLPQRLPWTPYPHFHKEEFELTLLTKGNFCLELPGRSLPLEGGAAALIPSQIAHTIQYGSGERFEHHAIRFQDLPQRCALWRTLTGDGVRILSNSRYIRAARKLLLVIQEVAKENGGLIDARIQTLAQSVLELLGEELRQAGTAIKTSAPEYANDILIYLQNHIHEKVTMEDLSRVFHLSASHISRVFSKTYHTSPINYLIYCRMRQARLHILKGDLTISEIAKSLAFHDSYHFARTFEQFFGCHPKRYLEESQESVGLQSMFPPI